MVAPVTPTPAFKLGEKTDDPLKMYLEDIYSVAASLAGICGVSVPCGETTEGLPIGVQVMGRHFDEATMLRVGAAECERGWENWCRRVGRPYVPSNWDMGEGFSKTDG